MIPKNIITHAIKTYIKGPPEGSILSYVPETSSQFSSLCITFSCFFILYYLLADLQRPSAT